jgi:peptidyl-prolyl cis-trans isomerase C/foldase protein PrsA
VSEAEIQRATEGLSDSVQRAGSSFGQRLATDGQTPEQLHDEMRERLVAEKYVADQTRRELPSKAEVRAYYEQHKTDYEQPEMAHVQAITVASADEAKSLLDQLRKGASFDELARTHGTTPDARAGGDLGWFARGTMPKEFDDVAFSLPPGKLSGVLRTPYGFHVLKVLGRRPARKRPFEDVRADVERRAVADKQAEAERQLLAQLRKSAEIRVDEPVLAQVK